MQHYQVWCVLICPTFFLHLSCPADSIFPATILCMLCHIKLLLSYCTFVVRQTVLSTPGYKLLTFKKKKKKKKNPKDTKAKSKLVRGVAGFPSSGGHGCLHWHPLCPCQFLKFCFFIHCSVANDTLSTLQYPPLWMRTGFGLGCSYPMLLSYTQGSYHFFLSFFISKSCELQVSSVAAQVCIGLHSQYTSANFVFLSSADSYAVQVCEAD